MAILYGLNALSVLSGIKMENLCQFWAKEETSLNEN